MKSDESLLELPLGELVTIGDAAKIAFRDRNTIHGWMKQGIVRGVKASTGLWLVRRDDVILAAEEAQRTLAVRVLERREAEANVEG